MNPDIDYIFWRERYINDIESGKPKERTRRSLNNIRKQILKYLTKSDDLYNILIEDEFENRTMKIIEQFAYKIADNISISKESKEINLDYLTIFDAINAWGGSAIRLFYTNSITILHDEDKTKKVIGIPRKLYAYWLEYYRQSVEFIKNGEFDVALKIIDDNIPGIGVSFGTKHIWFWSEYFKSKNTDKTFEIATVFDERMARLFFGKSANSKDYPKIRTKFKAISDELNSKYDGIKKFDSKDVERSIFAFSQFYFNNNLTNWGEAKYKNPRIKKDSNYLVNLKKINEFNATLNFFTRESLKNEVNFKVADEIFKSRNPEMYLLIEKVESK